MCVCSRVHMHYAHAWASHYTMSSPQNCHQSPVCSFNVIVKYADDTFSFLNPSMHLITQTTTLSRLLYAAPFW